MNEETLHELLYQALETEIGGVEIYKTAIQCAVNNDVKEEWQKYLDETTRHVEIVEEIFGKVGLDPAMETPGRQVVRHLGHALVEAMQQARSGGGSPEGAELVAAECVVMAETKDHQNWELIGQLIEKNGAPAKVIAALKPAYEEVEDQEDEHLYHTMGWARELWIQFLGMPAVLPPPEEAKSVKTAIGAARAAQSRNDMLKSS